MFDFTFGDAKPLDEPSKELTDEIKSFRQRNKEFAATNEHQTYAILCFSCKADLYAFLDNVGLPRETLLDGYLMAKLMNVQPQKPSLKLAEPIKAKKKKVDK